MPFKPSREQTGAEASPSGSAKKASGFVLYDIPPSCVNGPEGNAVFYETPGIWASPPPRPPVSMPDSAVKRRGSAKTELSTFAVDATSTSGDEDKKACTTSSIFTKTRMCRFIALGLCRKGEACAYAHHKEELQPVPDLYRTKLCPAFFQTGSCKDPSCRFAHSKNELRTHSSLKRGSGDRSKKLSHITSPHKAGRLSNLAAPLPVGCTTPTNWAKSKSGRELLPTSKQSTLENEIGVSTASTDYPSDDFEGYFFAPLQRMTTDSFIEMGHVVYPVPQLPFDESDDDLEHRQFVLQSKNTFLELGPKKSCEDHYPRDTCHKAAGILFVCDSQLGA